MLLVIYILLKTGKTSQDNRCKQISLKTYDLVPLKLLGSVNKSTLHSPRTAQ